MSTETNKSKTLLIAEDEEINFILLKALLSSLNLNILRAKNGLEAVEFCKSNGPLDLILMDIRMPVMDGCEATKQIRGFMPNLPIIAQTAFTTEAEKSKAFESGCNDFINKPIKKEILLDLVKEHLCLQQG
jgi:CheY-like chemotaxis protein